MVAVFEDMPLPARGIGEALQRNLDYCHLSYDLYAQLPPVIKSRIGMNARDGKPFDVKMLEWTDDDDLE